MKIAKSHIDNGIKCADIFEITSREVESLIAIKCNSQAALTAALYHLERGNTTKAIDCIKIAKQSVRDINLKVTE